jgi:hypothetical protein
MKRNILFGCLVLLLPLAALSSAQVATGGTYSLNQAVLAGGGGTSTGGNFAVEGTIGQAIAGVQSNGGNFGANGGFWQAFFAPTAALVSVSGQISSSDGEPLQGVKVTLGDGSSNLRAVRSSITGEFHFYGVEVGQTYILSARGKTTIFVPIVVSVQNDISDIRLVALP